MLPTEPKPEETQDVSALRIDRSKRGARSNPWIARAGGVIAVVVAFQFGIRPCVGKVSEMTRPEVQVHLVTRQTASERASVTGVASNGYIVARVRAALSADAPGRLVEMNVVEGSVVEEGTVVARLYYAEYEALLARAEAASDQCVASLARGEADIAAGEAGVQRADSDLRASQAAREAARAKERLAETDLERAKQLVADGVERVQFLDRAVQEFASAAAEEDRADATVDSAMASVTEARSLLASLEAALAETAAKQRVAEADVAAAAANLDKTYIRAPFAGVVVHKEAEVGEVVSPNSQGGRSRGSVATIVDLESLEVQAEVPETSLSAVHVGGSARVFLDAWPSRGYEVRVDRVWPIADRQKATVEVRAVFLEPDERLRPEMGLRIVFRGEGVVGSSASDEGPLIKLPASAVVERGGAQGVFLIEASRVRFHEVQCAEGPPGSVAVAAGLVGGEKIVLRPTDDLSDGDAVRIS